MKKYNNPRIENYFPNEEDLSFIKFKVMEGDKVATDGNDQEMIFQDKEKAMQIVNARKKHNLRLKISEIQSKANKEIELLEKDFQLNTRLNSGVYTKVFDTFLNVKAETIEQLKDFILNFPATDEPIKDEHIKDYDFNYKIGISNNSDGRSTGEIRYKNSEFEYIWLEFPIELLNNFIHHTSRGASESEHVYFMGTKAQDLKKIKIPSVEFKGSQVNYYGGDKGLKDAEIAKQIIESFLK